MAKTTTIDQLSLDTYLKYAEQQELLAEIYQQFPPDQVSAVSERVKIYTAAPQPTALQELFGGIDVVSVAPWATFESPETLYGKKQSAKVAFGVSRILSSLGTMEQFGQLQEKVRSQPCGTQEEEREKSCISSCLGMVQKINHWLNDIYNRIHQFMHG